MENPKDTQTIPGSRGEIDSRLQPGYVLDRRYRLIRPLEAGGMGQVFEALHLNLDQRKALKILRGAVAKDEKTLQRFLSEAKITAALKHPNIVEVSDSGVSEDGFRFIAMEYLEGETLDDLVRSGKRDTDHIATALGYMIGICDGLAYAHEKNVIHRDLKPKNIFLHRTEGGEIVPKILDFGIAKLTGVETVKITQTGEIFGTSKYVSPEMILGRELDLRADVYALGVCLYEVLTGQNPFARSGQLTSEAVYVNIMDEEFEVVPPRQLNPAVTDRLDKICMRALERAPDDRYQEVGELAQALYAASEEYGVQRGAKGATTPPRPIKGFRGAIYLGLVILIGGAGVIVYTLVTSEEPTPEPPSDQGSQTSDEESLTTLKTARQPEAIAAPAVRQDASIKEESVEKAATAGRKEPGTAGATDVPVSSAKSPEGPPEEPDVDAEDLVVSGNAALRTMDFGAAREWYEKALEIDPNNAGAWFGLGKIDFQQKSYQGSISRIEHALSLKNKPAWRTYLGRVHMQMGEQEKAKEQWRRVLADDPGNEKAKALLESSGAPSQ